MRSCTRLLTFCALLGLVAGPASADYEIIWNDDVHLMEYPPRAFESMFGDVDGDNALELVATWPGPRVVIIDAMTGVQEFQTSFNIEVSTLALIDLDRDGTPEVVIGGYSGGEQTWVVDFVGPAAAPGAESLQLRSEIHNARPNPLNPNTVIPFILDSAGQVDLAIYNVSGRLVRRLVEGNLDAGEYSVTWDGRGDGGQRLASGQYFYQLSVGGQVVGTQKAVILK